MSKLFWEETTTKKIRVKLAKAGCFGSKFLDHKGLSIMRVYIWFNQIYTLINMNGKNDIGLMSLWESDFDNYN